MRPEPTTRDFLRMALRIHERIASRRAPTPLGLPLSEWRRLQEIAQRIVLAQSRGWSAAKRFLLGELDRAALTLIRRLEHVRDSLAEPTERPAVSLREILADLVGLRQEFGAVTIDLRKNRLSVVTEPIVLEGVPLGRFEIVVSLGEPDDRLAYEVEALDAETSARSSGMTHPHVHDNLLCEGEGRTSIRAALSEGRLFDFFLLVRQILETYNPTSAYVSLRQWQGCECHDCGSRAAEDDATTCGRCDVDLCLDCSDHCSGCERSVCSNCRHHCHECEETVCDRCAVSCPDCREVFCPKCLPVTPCAGCRKLEEPADDAPQAVDTTCDPSVSPVLSGGLGQVPLPA